MIGDMIQTPKDVSKELESLAFQAVKIAQIIDNKDDFVSILNKHQEMKSAFKNNKILPEAGKNRYNEPKTQLESFQKAMRPLFLLGQCIGLNPVFGVSETIPANIRFTVYSWRFLYSIIMAIWLTLALILSLYFLFKKSISINSLGYISFYGSTCATVYLFIQIAQKWQNLMRSIVKSSLDEYVDKKIVKKCHFVTFLILFLSVLEHTLSIFHKIIHIVLCQPDVEFYEEFLRIQFPWYYGLNVSMNLPFGIFLQVLNIMTTINWNYLDLYIVCISMYLASLLKNINRKIITVSEKHYLPSCHWRVLREEYNRAARLVKSFDDVISGLVFTSFSCNLFFICLQIFNILAHGANFRSDRHACDKQINEGLLGGYEYAIYLIFSTTFLLLKSLTVSLVAASVNTASLVPAPALYNVPSSAYCEEVSRFITQVNEDKVALTGLQFFYVTRELVLTVAGTIVTYELVLLQFSGNEFN